MVCLLLWVGSLWSMLVRMECIFLLEQRWKLIVIKQHTHSYSQVRSQGLRLGSNAPPFESHTPTFIPYTWVCHHTLNTRDACVMMIEQCRSYLSWFRVCESLILRDCSGDWACWNGFKDFWCKEEAYKQYPGWYFRPAASSTSECLQHTMSAASSDTFEDVCARVE